MAPLVNMQVLIRAANVNSDEAYDNRDVDAGVVRRPDSAIYEGEFLAA